MAEPDVSAVLPDTPAPNHSGGIGGGGLLTKRFHGIPIIPVAVVSGLLIAFVLYRRSKTAPANTLGAVPTSAVTDDATTLPDAGGGFSGNDQSALDTLTTGNGVGPSTTTSLTLTNQQWATNAINGLVGQNPNDGINIGNAISNFVNGIPLANPQQQAYVNQAIAAYGEPPENILQTSLGPQVAQVTAGSHPYTVKKGDTVDRILQATYGQVDPALNSAFWADNPTVYRTDGRTRLSASSPADLLKPGQQLHLPIFTEGTLP